MKILSRRLHGFLDYATVMAFAVTPLLLGLEGLPKLICYSLAGVHLVLTLMTDFPLGIVKFIPSTIHGLIELIVSIALFILPWVLGFATNPVARNFFIAAGATILIVWRLTDYKTN